MGKITECLIVVITFMTVHESCGNDIEGSGDDNMLVEYPLNVPIDLIDYDGKNPSWSFNDNQIPPSHEIVMMFSSEGLVCINNSEPISTDRSTWKSIDIKKASYAACTDSSLLDKFHKEGTLQGVEFEELYENQCTSDQYCNAQCQLLKPDLEIQLRLISQPTFEIATERSKAERNVHLQEDTSGICNNFVKQLFPIVRNDTKKGINVNQVIALMKLYNSNKETLLLEDDEQNKENEIKDFLYNQVLYSINALTSNKGNSYGFNMVTPNTNCLEDFFCSNSLDHAEHNSDHLTFIPDPNDSGLHHYTTKWGEIKEAISKLYLGISSLPSNGFMGKLMGDLLSTWFSGNKKGFKSFTTIDTQQEVSFDTSLKLLMKLKLDEKYQTRALYVYMKQTFDERSIYDISKISYNLVCVIAVVLCLIVLTIRYCLIISTNKHDKLVCHIRETLPLLERGVSYHVSTGHIQIKKPNESQSSLSNNHNRKSKNGRSHSRPPM